MKRFFDLVLAIFLLVLLLIPFSLLLFLIVTTSKGSSIYWSKRIGQYNKTFYMPKLRTMVLDTPEVATHLLEDAASYYTPLGKFLRKYSIDELPQLYSVILGDMSFVGPRPALHTQTDLIELRTEEGIDALIPGITGLAQVSGRDEISLVTKVGMDAKYLKDKSFLFDLKIIWLTILRVLQKDGVSH